MLISLFMYNDSNNLNFPVILWAFIYFNISPLLALKLNNNKMHFTSIAFVIYSRLRFFTTIMKNRVTNRMFLLRLPLDALICPGKQSQLPWKMKLGTYKLLPLLDSSDRNSSLVWSPSHLMCYTLSKYLDVLAPKNQHDLEITTKYYLDSKYWYALNSSRYFHFLFGLLFTWGVKFRYNSYSTDSSCFNNLVDIILCVYVLWWICSFCTFDKIMNIGLIHVLWFKRYNINKLRNVLPQIRKNIALIGKWLRICEMPMKDIELIHFH